jgi:hypothetical protein
MSVELRVHSGALTGRTFRFDQPTVVIGRQPTCDIAFDPVEDRDVSGKHAEIRLDGHRAFVRDTGSTNGTWVNGVRIAGEQELVDGDFVSFGKDGPRLAVGLATPARASGAGAPPPTRVSSSNVAPAAAAGPPRRDTTMRIAEAVQQSTRGLQRTLIGVTIVLGLGAIGAYMYGKRESDKLIAELIAQNSALGARYDSALTKMNGRSSGLDTALRAAKQEIDALNRKLRAGGGSVDVEEMKKRLADATSRASALVGQANMDLSAINEKSGKAVVLLVVEMPDGSKAAASGFAINDKGLIVTNRHAVREAGVQATRIAVKFAETDKWLRAHVVRVNEGDDDLAVLQLDAPGPFPVVAGVGTATDAPRVGQPVAIIGFPLGLDIATEGGTLKGAAHATLNSGTVSKSVDARTQIDGYAAQGSSGSPVFDNRGFVIGVVFGGPTEAQGRIVYAVPVARLAAELAK